MQFTDEEKMSLTIDILNITHGQSCDPFVLTTFLTRVVKIFPSTALIETLESGHSIDELISHGIDLLTILLPQTASGEELR